MAKVWFRFLVFLLLFSLLANFDAEIAIIV